MAGETPPIVPPIVPPAPAWYEGKVDAETLGTWKNKGYDVTDPVKVATELTKWGINAEKLIGAPPDQIIRLPKAGDEAGTKAMWQKLGVPADAKDYDFTSVKNAAGEAMPDKLADAIRATAAATYITKDAAARVATAVMKHNDDTAAEAAAVATAALQVERDALKKDWGVNEAANKFIAQQAALKLGLKPNVIEAIEKASGYKDTMNALLKLGQGLGELKVVQDPANPNPGVMSRDQAIAKRAELQRDPDWSKRYLAGGAPETREMIALNTIISG